MISQRLESLLDTPIKELSEDDFREVARELPDEWSCYMARIKVRMQDPATPERTALYLDLLRRYQRSLDYYRERAEDAQWRLIGNGVRGNEPSAGACCQRKA